MSAAKHCSMHFRRLEKVTGGGNGIGRSILLEIARIETDLTLVSWEIDSHANEKTVEQLRALGVRQAVAMTVNITDESHVKAAAEKVRRDVGHVTMLFNNAGIVGPLGNIWEVDFQHARRTVETNLLSHMSIAKEFLPHMIASNKGHVIGTASIVSFFPKDFMSVYVTSKHAVRGYYECLKEDLRLQRQRANSVMVTTVYPGPVATDLLASAKMAVGSFPILMRPVDPSAMASRIIHGVRTNEEHIFMPAMLKFTANIFNWATPDAKRRIIDIFKVSYEGKKST